MKKLTRNIALLFICFSLFLPIILPVQQANAVSCQGLSELTDPLAIQMEKENGNSVIWERVQPSLIQARDKYINLIKAKGWRIQYTSAYRPYEYQRHLYEISVNKSSCAYTERVKHQLGNKVAPPSSTAPHTKGVAFDAIIYDKNGKALNSFYFVSSSVVEVAKQAGLYFPHRSDDAVHHQLINEGPAVPVTPVTPLPIIATGKVTNESGLNVRSNPNASATRIGGVYKGDKVDIVEIVGDWYKIKFGSSYGYINNLGVTLDSIPAQPELKIGYITNDSGLNVRNSPSTSGARIGGVYKGDKVEIIETIGDWYKIKFGLGYGYIYNVGVTLGSNPVPTPPQPKFGYITNNSGLNVRNSPSTSGTRIGGVYKGDKVEIIETIGDWYKIKFGTGFGYINKIGVQLGQ